MNHPFVGITTPAGNAQIVWQDASGKTRSTPANADALSIAVHLATPIRKGPKYRHRRNYEGFYWFSKTGRHVWYESMTEYTALMGLDHRCDIRAISSQPMYLLFGDGTGHYPDLFAEHADGRRVVYNVKPRDLFDDKASEQSVKTAELCAAVGWGFEDLHDVSRIERHNLEWMAAYRHERNNPSAFERERILESLKEPRAFSEVASVLDPDRVPAHIHKLYSLMWDGSITFDHELPLSPATELRRNPK